MTKQKPHTRRSKTGKLFQAGKGFVKDVALGVLIIPYGASAGYHLDKMKSLEKKVKSAEDPAAKKKFKEELKQANKQFNKWYASAKRVGLVK